jgi:GTPase SAR1 family protein
MQGPKERETREDYIKKAEVVCIVFDLTRESTLDSIIDYWIPYVQSLQAENTTPLLIVGNKLDQLASPSRLNHSIEEKIESILRNVRILLLFLGYGRPESLPCTCRATSASTVYSVALLLGPMWTSCSTQRQTRDCILRFLFLSILMRSWS